MDNRIITGILLTIIICFATSAWAGTWIDDFEDGNLDGWQKVDVASDVVMVVKEATGKVNEKEGNLIVTDNIDVLPNSTYPTMVGFNNGQNIKDFTLAVDAKIAKLTIQEYCWWYIHFRSNGNDSFAGIFFSVAQGSGTYTWLAIGDVKTNFPHINYFGVVQSPFIFDIDKWYHIDLEMNGSQAKVWVDKELMWQADWKDLPDWLSKSGSIYLGGWGMELHLDNFVLTSDDVMDVTSVNPKGILPATWAKIKYNR